MKTIALTVTLIFLAPLSLALESSNGGVKCTESPDKKNPLKHGHVFIEVGRPEEGTYYAERIRDACKDETTLLQVSCYNHEPQEIKINCKQLNKKCRKGRCVQ